MGATTQKQNLTGGDIIKRTPSSSLEIERAGNCSLTKAAYIIGIRPMRTQIIEHLWNLDNVPIAQAYLCVKETEGYSSMQYVFTDPTYNINPGNLKTFLSLTLVEYLGYQGVQINNLHLIVPQNHLEVALFLFAPQIQEGLQVSVASAA